MRRHPAGWFAAFAAAIWIAPSPVSAQSSTFGSSSSASSEPALAGWSATPALAYSGGWDDNVLYQGTGDSATADFVSVVNPRVDVAFNGRRGQLGASYSGAFLFYRDFDSLNSYEQHAGISARRLVSRRVTLFAHGGLAVVPTTELSVLVGLPFLRTGSRVADLRGGIETGLAKHTRLTTAYEFVRVEFDENSPFAQLLRGGYTHGVSLALHHELSARTAFIADSEMQHAIVGGGEKTFDVINAGAGVEHRLTETVRVYGTFGISRLGISDFGPARTGPSVHAGLTRQFRTAGVDVLYNRSYVPSYGIGGTTQNKELTARLRLPLSRRVYSQSSVSWRSNEPLMQGDLDLKSWWVEGSIGYAAQPWMHIEAFYGGTHQKIDRPGGIMDRNRVGFQVVTTKPVRIR